VTITPPRDWQAALRAHPPRPLDPARMGRLVVVSAHPDDETLAVGGLMRAVHAAGGEVELVVATDGEAAFPVLDSRGRADLRRVRRRELDDALRTLGLGSVRVHRLAMPDSALDADTLADALRPLLADADAVLAPWSADPHPDHAAAGHAAGAAAPVTATVWAYPIWFWPWRRPDDPAIPWAHAFAHALDDEARAVKREAVACFGSQLRPGPDGEVEILPPAVLEHFDTTSEVVFRSPRTGGAPLARFDELYAAAAGDPWDTHTSWYERRKRAVLLASLPREHYRHAAEPGCGTGALTAELALRCDRLDASDFAEAAVDQARAAAAGLAGVTVARSALPDADALPDGIDLAVLSEVLYYLAGDELAATIDRLAGALAPGGDVVVAHWSGDWPADAPRDAAATHRVLLDDPRFTRIVEHDDDGFLLHVLRRR
jgi:LmbE family N-acetylglucosaminyl deacetylase